MIEFTSDMGRRLFAPAVLRTGLFLIAASLAFYFPFKYATQLHAISGLYAFVFPFSAILALAGIALAVKPGAACNCSGSMRAGAGVIAASWMAIGLLCVPSLVEMARVSSFRGAFAMVHMLTQHVVLSAAILAFAYAPDRMASLFGARRGREISRPTAMKSVEAIG